MKRILLSLLALVACGTLMAQNATLPGNITLRTLDGQTVQSSVIQKEERL